LILLAGDVEAGQRFQILDEQCGRASGGRDGGEDLAALGLQQMGEAAAVRMPRRIDAFRIDLVLLERVENGVEELEIAVGGFAGAAGRETWFTWLFSPVHREM